MIEESCSRLSTNQGSFLDDCLSRSSQDNYSLISQWCIILMIMKEKKESKIEEIQLKLGTVVEIQNFD